MIHDELQPRKPTDVRHQEVCPTGHPGEYGHLVAFGSRKQRLEFTAFQAGNLARLGYRHDAHASRAWAAPHSFGKSLQLGVFEVDLNVVDDALGMQLDGAL